MQHVVHTFLEFLTLVLDGGDGEVVLKDGEGIDKNVVLVEPNESALLFGTVGVAEEAFPLVDGLVVDLGASGNDSGRVELHFESAIFFFQLVDDHVL